MKKPSQQYFCELVNLHMIVGKAEIIDFMKLKNFQKQYKGRITR